MPTELLPKLRTLHYLFYTGKSMKRIAHCLDLDIVASAGDDDEAERRLDVLVKIYVERALASGNYSSLGKVAPTAYWTRFSTGTPKEPRNRMLAFRIPDVMPLDQTESSLGVLAACAAA